MTTTNTISMTYGTEGRLSLEVDPERVVMSHGSVDEIPDIRLAVREALEHPLDFPPVVHAVVPGDRITIALDRHTPRSSEIIAEVWEMLDGRGVTAEDVFILQPVGLDGRRLSDPRSLLPESVRSLVRWGVHDPTDKSRQCYLASTSCGERIYLARELVDADFIFPIGEMTYDPVLGIRGTSSVFFPGLSTVEAIDKARGEGHWELGPEDDRPLRQAIDEIGWLLGIQVTLQVLSASGTGVAEVICGTLDAVGNAGRQALANHWRVEQDEHADIVVVAVDADAAGHGWQQVGQALETAQRLVSRHGTIVVLSQIEEMPGDGLKLLTGRRKASESLRTLRKQLPPDLVSTSQLIHAVDWARVYLMSRLPGDLVEELFVTPVETDREVERLLAGSGSISFIASAQHTFGHVGSTV
ncbi:MAG: lactate racemase domain-containing protein [Planctomycetota bacterium]|nr:lactate racemase domain-containing protein [Planctomycetota bacterium]